MPIRQSLRAEEDLDRVFRESVALLGENEAERYLACLLRAITILGLFPELGRQADENPVLRRHLHGDMVILYRVDADSLAVLQVGEQAQLQL